MGYIDYCSLCKYVYTKDCNYGSKECNQEKARIMLEVSRFEKMGAKDVQPINQWISCKDKMPEDNTSVLFVYVSENGIKSVHYGYHQTLKGLGSSWAKPSGGWEYSDEDVTHWQPIPEPPVND